MGRVARTWSDRSQVVQSRGVESPFDIVHLSTSAMGGAGIAARRSAKAQSDHSGFRVAVVTRSSDVSPDEALDESVGVVNLGLGLTKSGLSKVVTLTNRVASKPSAMLFTPLSMSTIQPGHPVLRGCQYLHIHNAYNLISANRILGLSAGPILISLHDERQLTNGCHYTLGCSRFQTDCHSCPQSRLPRAGVLPFRRANHHFFKRASQRVSFIAPSHWMVSQALSAGLSESRVFHVPNAIDTVVFHPHLRSRARTDLGLPSQSRVIAWQPGKSDASLVSALHQLHARLPRDITRSILVLTPTPAPLPLPFATRSIGTLATELERARFWAAADVGVSATRMDNFPNVVLEALAVGTPFVIPNVGGAGEAISLTGGGLVVQDPEPDQISRALQDLIVSPTLTIQMGHQGRAGVESHYNYRKFASRMDEIYRETGYVE